MSWRFHGKSYFPQPIHSSDAKSMEFCLKLLIMMEMYMKQGLDMKQIMEIIKFPYTLV